MLRFPPFAYANLTRLALVVAAFALGAPALAQNSAADRLAELERRLESSLARIEALTDRVRQLEAERAAPAVAVPSNAASPRVAEAPAVPAVSAPSGTAAGSGLSVPQQLASLERQVEALVNRPDPEFGIPLHGFMDVGALRQSGARERGGAIGSLDFYLTPRFGDRVVSLVELIFEANTEGSIAPDLERLQIGYQFGDEATLWFGRFHTPYGYWNTAYHHGAQIQTSLLRPRFVDFEDRGGILPAHSIGLWLNGSRRLGDGRARYDLWVANTPRLALRDRTANGTGNLNPTLVNGGNGGALLGLNLGYSPSGALQGLTVGMHAMSAQISDDAQAQPARTDLRVLGGYAVYMENDWELVSEHYAFRNGALDGSTHSSRASFAQVGKVLGRLTPYLRFERSVLDQGDPYFAQQTFGQSYRRSALGLRYDLNPRTALKLEALRTRLTDRSPDDYSELRAQWAVRF